jgi:hypothetical protein
MGQNARFNGQIPEKVTSERLTNGSFSRKGPPTLLLFGKSDAGVK